MGWITSKALPRRFLMALCLRSFWLFRDEMLCAYQTGKKFKVENDEQFLLVPTPFL
jgi:hypothetical protein